jgi:uncharacterized coiled-coil protein SlyX
MSENSWNTGVMEEAQQHEPVASPETMSLRVDDFAALEERVLRAVELVRRERACRVAIEERASHAESQLHRQTSTIDELQQEVKHLRAERDHVRQRVERLLAQLDALEL